MTTNLFSDSLREEIISGASEAEAGIKFPGRAFAALRKEELLQIFLPGNELELNKPNTGKILHLLRMVGAADLSVARIYEGHLNALMLIGKFGTEDQKARFFALASKGKVFGIWNTQAENGIRFTPLNDYTFEITGEKTFCSGSADLDYPIITGQLSDHGWQMAIVNGEELKERVNNSFWDPLGMKASVSHRIDFTGITVEQGSMIGRPGDYYEQPWFSGGAIRFSAAQIGGAQAVLQETILYLRSLGRTDDYAQKTRIAEMAVLINTGIILIESAGKLADDVANGRTHPDKLMAFANMMRLSTEELSTRIMQLSERSVGARGLMRPGRLERLHRDLRYYLRQPAPDATLIAVADYVLSTNHNTNDLWS